MLSDLNVKAKLTTQILNSIEGVTLNEVAGAMYAFPQIKLPPKVLEAAKVKPQIVGDIVTDTSVASMISLLVSV